MAGSGRTAALPYGQAHRTGRLHTVLSPFRLGGERFDVTRLFRQPEQGPGGFHA